MSPPQRVTQPSTAATAVLPRHLSWTLLVGLHVLPGILIALGFAVLALALAPAGAPPNLALLLAFLLVAMPVELGYLLYQSRRAAEQSALVGEIGFREPISHLQAAGLVVPLFLWSALTYTLLAPTAELFRMVAFAWWPSWLALGELVLRLGQLDRTMLWAIVGLSLVLNVVGPIVEELYFRGHLLPRMERLGRWAPLVNVAFFSLYHFWLPWEFFSRVVALLPAVYVVWWKRNVTIGIWVHVLLNSTGSVGLLVLVLSQG